MITEAVLDAVFSLVSGILSLVPDIDITVPANIISSAAQYLTAAFYILPMNTVFHICSLLVLLQAFRIAVSIIKTIWALLPIV